MSTNYNKLTDIRLVQLLKVGDERAYRILFDRYKELLFRHALRMTNDIELSKDIIQEVFLMLWNKRSSLQKESSLESYLYKTTRNKILDYFSHQNIVEKHREHIQQYQNEAFWYTDDYLLEKELATLIAEEKEKLSPKTRIAFELNREQGYSYKEISELLSISEKTVKKQVHNALRILRTKFNRILFLFF